MAAEWRAAHSATRSATASGGSRNVRHVPVDREETLLKLGTGLQYWCKINQVVAKDNHFPQTCESYDLAECTINLHLIGLFLQSQHHAQQQDYKSIPYPPSKEAPSAEEKAKLMAQTAPMEWSPLQCVITEAKMKVQDVGGGGSEGNEGGAVQVLLKGYGLGEKGRSNPYWTISVCRLILTSFTGVPLTEVDVVFLTLPSSQPYEPSLDEELTKQAAAKSDRSKRVKIASTGGKKNWGWILWEAEVALDGLHAMTGGETRGQIVAVAKASTYTEQSDKNRH